MLKGRNGAKSEICLKGNEGKKKMGMGTIITIAVVANIALHAHLRLENYLFEREIDHIREGRK